MKRFKEWVADLAITLMHWNEVLLCAFQEGIFDALDEIRWAIDGQLHRMFGWGFDGSEEELEMALNDEIPEHAWDDALRARVQAHLAAEEAERKRWALSTWLAPEIRKEAA